MSLVDEVCDAKPLMMQASIPPALLPQSPRSWINYRLPAINVLPSLLNHFLELRAEHIHLPAYKIATKCNVKPVSLLAFHDEFVGLSDFSDVRAHTGREGRSAIN